uniref:Patatin like phospholipase domain containing 5 n=1 Tax=Marmota marmota marmota TaxID=9994 RepID=A0A8C6EMW8_MARMA
MDFLEEGSWSLSFAGAGFLGLYHVGVTQCLSQRAPRLLQGMVFSGWVSAGAPVDQCPGDSLWDCPGGHSFRAGEDVALVPLLVFEAGGGVPAATMVGRGPPAERRGTQTPSSLEGLVAPPHLHTGQESPPLCRRFLPRSEKSHSRGSCPQALVCTLYFPFYCGTIPPEFRGQRYIDGALSNNLPFADCPSTITVSPFHGTVDICPRSTSASLHELNAFNASFQISTKNFFLGFISLIPPKPEVVADSCRQGYLDALRFLEARGLTKEPVLWTLVSRDPPAPPARTPDDGVSFNCHVPTVLVKDVPSLEQLSPELEAALRKAVRRDPSAWARFRRSGPGKVLTYLLLPCTLPFEYVYFRGRRLVIWLPDAPADLWWMWGLVKSTALEIHSRTKAQGPGGHQLLPRTLGRQSTPLSCALLCCEEDLC